MNPINSEQKQLLEAIRFGDLPRVKFLVQEKEINPNFGYDIWIENNPIVVAALKDQFDIAVWLLTDGGVILKPEVTDFVTLVVGNISISNYIYEHVISNN